MTCWAAVPNIMCNNYISNAKPGSLSTLDCKPWEERNVGGSPRKLGLAQLLAADTEPQQPKVTHAKEDNVKVDTEQHQPKATHTKEDNNEHEGRSPIRPPAQTSADFPSDSGRFCERPVLASVPSFRFFWGPGISKIIAFLCQVALQGKTFWRNFRPNVCRLSI